MLRLIGSIIGALLDHCHGIIVMAGACGSKHQSAAMAECTEAAGGFSGMIRGAQPF
jgi:hypothetical protein